MKPIRQQIAWVAFAAAVFIATAQATPRDSVLTWGRFGDVALYEPAGPPRELVLLLSGDDGWTGNVTDMARELAARGALVAGLDMKRFGAALRDAPDACAYIPGELEAFAHDLERRLSFTQYVNPVLVGYASGAALAYAALVQSPPGTFKGAISLGFCPGLKWDKPLCAGSGPGLVARPDASGLTLEPATGLRDRWMALHIANDQYCDAAAVRAFAGRMSTATLIELPGAGQRVSAERDDWPQLVTAFEQLAAVRSPLVVDAPSVSGLPLVEVPARNPARDMFAVMLSGDGGWAGLDRELADELATAGVAVVGWDSLRYFWTARTPDGAAADLARIVRHYRAKWGKTRVVLIGYSLGADTLPFMVNRLPPDARAPVALTALLAPGREAFFEFHVTQWLGQPGGGLPVIPELKQLAGSGVLCLHGAEEPDSACAGLSAPGLHSEQLPGGHHFDGDYRGLARRILQAIP